MGSRSSPRTPNSPPSLVVPYLEAASAALRTAGHLDALAASLAALLARLHARWDADTAPLARYPALSGSEFTRL